MGQINNNQLLAWFGTSTETCAGQSIGALDGKLIFTSRIEQAGVTGDSTPQGANFFIEYQNFECGTASLLSSVGSAALDTPYEIVGATATSLSANAGLLEMAYPETVTLAGSEDGSGTYKMTTTFKNNNPTYKNGEWWMWYDGTVWVISKPAMDKTGTSYDGPTAIDGSVDLSFPPIGVTTAAGALHTEDSLSVLSVEDVSAVITTEG